MTDADAIRRAAAEWVWLPRDSDHVVDGMVAVRYPARFGGGVRVSAFDREGTADEAVDAALERARDWGERRTTFWVGASDRPAGLADALLRRGAVHEDTVTVFALALDEATPGESPGVAVETVRTREQLRDVDAVNVPVWEQAPLDEAGLDAELRELEADWSAGRGFRVLARIDGRPVSTGGATIVGEFARLWGAATLASDRGRGAYRAVLAERLRLARAFGASTALVKGRVSTSAPILARAGFRTYGEERAYRLDVD
ncbi:MULTISPECIES: hypothetical protein [unclassified Microbacterium]|uniref:hypothetical protein n=1 Tax=Microbacterium TaxID=33882 RepID=UPI003BA0EE8D